MEKNSKKSIGAWAMSFLDEVLTPGMIGLVLIAMLSALCLTGCSKPSKATVTFTKQYEYAEETIEEIRTELFLRSHAVPEVLATTMSAFPTTAAKCDLQDTNAQSIDYVLSWEANGGKVQQKLLDALLLILANPETEIEIYSCSGTVTELMPMMAEDAPELTPRWMEIEEVQADLTDGAMVVAITVTYEDGIRETGYFNASDSYQRIIFELGTVDFVD